MRRAGYWPGHVSGLLKKKRFVARRGPKAPSPETVT